MELFLLLSAGVIINGVHGYLLWSQRHERKWSISVHAVKSRQTYILYVAGHMLAGGLFLLFAKRFFLERYNEPALFGLVCSTYFFEIVQAILPSRGRYERPHTVAAYIMWFSFVSAGLLSLAILPVEFWARAVATLVYIPLLAMLYKAHTDRNKFYYYQMTMVILFYVSMFFVVVGSK
ncbi:MAG TPA: hypothetical protein PKD20_04015 [Candidatus Saccharibacteria bacterium]|nr:hypothetical protein [Candidatus Saccharibacteria bacterium]HMT56015.1 hypothetical protein [Candidatus Saccharibacteria bacterium]